jgi:hypothetical protein
MFPETGKVAAIFLINLSFKLGYLLFSSFIPPAD